ncbi:gametocyte-specific factor 1-like [Metopolophium dirhodum]|uniref:gametocyte-specific factor 1-like n=1 Tax=Metopolophium dirhodum TaxID=44670 RepID=UPI00298FC3E8|nr:gametocyte-specific factor 1-like [Metopolophium dirhodum]XP_060866757.1 gametocyte-specific factor 1-like [Metopolophium dirhodum]XP_060866759.1 gametocyte-specific factor 1-like [Metopolophium dirhodum]XP_060866760.1 gametocyte-specific factor 1-like [Metopolophium dirhodum]XP_060866761.1 gametocyte-specific factor 1-like [Metopolophium dirhodum]XP_060866762.1 gametocyte-specific factor 1-like [Metopolophium dirhodum]XP_060866763.1 gametocyte-specific factor 1-like [Metopolophium dirhodu
MESIHLGRNAASNVVHCPFNIAHTMPQKTLILHLTKCPDRKPNQSICPFNYLHVVETFHLAVHETQCPDRLDFDQMVYQTTETMHHVTLKGPEIIDDLDETWDDASTNQQRSNKTIPVQNVIKTINQKPCFMKPPAGCTKSERKKYRSEAQKAYRDVDLSYKPNSSINNRIDGSMAQSGSKNVNKGNQQGKNDGLFFGKRP